MARQALSGRVVGEDLDAASAAVRVGYEDPSYFSREYKEHFGAPAATGHRQAPQRPRTPTV